MFAGIRFVNGPCMPNVERLDSCCMPMILRMQRNGMLIDPVHFAKMSVSLQEDLDRLQGEVRDVGGLGINPGSPDQVAHLLFRHLKLKPKHRVKLTPSRSRESVDSEVLEQIASLHPVVPLLLQFSQFAKLKDSFTDKLPRMVGPDGRIRPNIKVTRVVSGRLATSDPNLMAIPVRTKRGRMVRDGFIPRPGWVLVTIDLSQIEMRVAAHIAQCLAMIDIFLRDGDIHSETASGMFGLPVDKLDKMLHRYPAKRVGFGILFLITAAGLMDQMIAASDPDWTREQREDYGARWTEEACGDLIVRWFKRYPEIELAIMRAQSVARRFGYIWDGFGRIRWVPEIKSVHKKVQQEGLRYPFSHQVQSFAQGVIKLGMGEIEEKLVEGKFNGEVEPLLQIHDELLFEAKKEVAEDLIAEAGKVLENTVRLDVPVRWSGGSGLSWGTLEK